MGRIIFNLDIQYSGQTTQALRTDTKLVDFFEQLQTQLFNPILSATCLQLVNIDGIHQRLFGQYRGLLGGSTDAQTQHSGWTPAGTHGRHGLEHPVDDTVGRVQHHHLGFVLRTAPFSRDLNIDLVARHHRHMDHRRGVVLGIDSRAGRIR